jgi:hypothetical protein
MKVTQLLILFFQLTSVIFSRNLSNSDLFDAQKRLDVGNMSEYSSASIMPNINQQIAHSVTAIVNTETITSEMQATATPVYVSTPTPIVIVVPAGPTPTPTLIPFPTLNFFPTEEGISGEIQALQHQSTTLEELKTGVLFNWGKIIQLWPFGVLAVIWIVLGVWFLASEKIE